MNWLKIVGMCILAAVGFGIALDQVTARICVYYFTVAHPIVVDTRSPTILGLVWGVLATWWVGGLLGLVLATSARAGKWPRLKPREFRRPLLITIVVMAIVALAAGALGYQVGLPPMVADFWVLQGVPSPQIRAFAADGWAIMSSYLSGLVAGIVLVCRTLLKRQRLHLLAMLEPVRPS